MVGYKASANAGNPFVEVDCHTLADGSVILMHDSTLERTTTSSGPVSALTQRELEKTFVDGRRLLGSKWERYPIPYFDEILATFGKNRIILAEAKDYESRTSILRKVKTYGVDKDHIIVNSVYPDRLHPAISAGFRTFQVLQDLKHSPAGLKRSGLWGVACPDSVTEEYVHALKAAGLAVICGPVNRHYQRDRFVQMGADGIFTDDPVYLDYSQAYREASDPYASQQWAAGMLAARPGARGYFVAPDKWGIDSSEANVYKGCLQGWMCPIGGTETTNTWILELSVTFGTAIQSGRWANVAILTTDAALDSDIAPSDALFGYHVLMRDVGGLAIYRYDGERNKAPQLLKETSGPRIAPGDTVRYRITVDRESIQVERTDGKCILNVKDASYRGAYVTFGCKGLRADFSKVRLTVPPDHPSTPQ